MTILNKHIDFWAIKFPIFFPIIYLFFLLKYPQYDQLIAFVTLVLLAEPHFGATWPFLLSRVNHLKILSEKITYILVPLIIIIISSILFVYNFALLFLIFFVANIFHVTRQSTGISSLYINNNQELEFQKKLIYFMNAVFFFIGFGRFYLNIPFLEDVVLISILSLIFIFLVISYYLISFNYSENMFVLITGMLIFFPMCFVSKPIHGILMGVTMHYTQYLILTYKISSKRININNTKEGRTRKSINLNFLFTVLLYGIFMAVLSTFSNSTNEYFKNLIFIPLIGQLLHFYYDSFLWRFRDKHHKVNSLDLLRS